ncbi:MULTISPECIES: histidine kinase [unclassified Arcicella]|uniref:histidine kinase n=1 Tax=unclassified Arcicella TaxID=2644986 RepID=UPI002866EC96|nr:MULTISPECIES: histidine kinase [unclassified Arcicella]MDR6564373.1 DUF4097 and DUF4098 domain-containing protein YvlB [Arcicella sp. BE51]MDR6814122.1 DUF4097 and DUF4098 domain-containing protein YvlB [Arcicella sp. BE140]MDR6825434.1 DUF4097 and DUF4098 domain-containing protein YvlB [Arcicella sp. BE139]
MNYKPIITKTYEVEAIKHLQLKTFSGDIELIGHDENTIKVEVYATVRSLFTFFLIKDPLLTFDYDAQDLTMNVVDDTLFIYNKPNYLNIYNWFNFQKTSFRVFLPANIHSNTKTYGGKIVLKKLEGNHGFSTWGGNILLEQTLGNIGGSTMGGNVDVLKCQGNVEASTMGGNIFLAGNNADIKIDTKGGNIYVQNNEGTIHCSSWGGNIDAFNVSGGFECNTAGGNINLKNVNGNIGASTKGGNIRAEVNGISQYAWFDTAGGNIKVALPLEQSLDLEVSASRVRLPPLQNFSGYQTKQSIRGKLNGGGANVTIKTLAGNITIYNADFASDTFKPNTPPKQADNPKTEAPPKFTEKKTPEQFQERPINTAKPYTESKPFSDNENAVHLKPNYNIYFNVVFCLLVGYAVTCVIFFTVATSKLPLDFSDVYQDIFYLTLMSSLAAIAAIYVFLNFVESRIPPIDLVKFMPLMGCALLFGNLFHSALSSHNEAGSLWAFDMPAAIYFYFVLPVIISWSYLFYWLRTRSITRKISEQEYQLLNLEKLKSKAQLDALEARINPHFLYNSLNSIAGLIHDKPDKAEEMTIQLSKLFRYTTGRTEESFHTFADELEIIKAYLTIEEVRFGHRLTYTIDCDESILDEKIPRFLLQPLVENAIKHGISKIASDGLIKVNITVQEGNIVIKIHDNGPDFGESFGGGFGLRSIKEKLKIVYGDKATIDIKNQPEKAVIIIIK